MRTDMTWLTIAFRSFANAPETLHTCLSPPPSCACSTLLSAWLEVCLMPNLREWHLRAVWICRAPEVPCVAGARRWSGSFPECCVWTRNCAILWHLRSPPMFGVLPATLRPPFRCCILAGCTCDTHDTSVMRVGYIHDTKLTVFRVFLRLHSLLPKYKVFKLRRCERACKSYQA